MTSGAEHDESHSGLKDMKPQITVAIQFENITFSFQTDESGAGVQDSVEAIGKIIASHGNLLKNLKPKGFKKTITLPISEISLENLSIPQELKNTILNRIRKVSYWNLVLIILYHAPRPLTYANLISISDEFRKPISYDWLNTEFHRSKFRGLVRSHPIHKSKEKAYSLTEHGRKKCDAILVELQNSDAK